MQNKPIWSPQDLESSLVMLLYHGVTSGPSIGIENFSRKHIDANEFERQMSLIKRKCTVLSIEDVVDIALREQSWPKNPVVVSFDDGFKNNATIAAPILDKFQIPAVFYICAGMIETNCMFWVDQIEDCINLTERYRICIELDSVVTFELGSPEDRIQAVSAIKAFCKKSDVCDKNRILANLMEATGVTPSFNHATNYKMMSWDEVKSIDRNSLFTIGGHTLYHDSLSAQTAENMRLDIQISLGLLEYNLQHSVKHYAYPEGQAYDYHQNVIDTLKEFGVVCSPTAIEGINPDGSDLFHLHRIMPGFMGRAFPYD